jgi:hypothetical protein
VPPVRPCGGLTPLPYAHPCLPCLGCCRPRIAVLTLLYVRVDVSVNLAHISEYEMK